jgi:uncharacterized membrane protein
MSLRTDESLSRPRVRRPLGVHYDPDAFGRFSEGIAHFLGTGRYLAAQTGLVIVWIGFNAAAVGLRWDPYPFILLNLAFSTQAAYAAPLILLAQNRQADRDKDQQESDRSVTFRTQADAEYLAREIASVRLQLEDMVTTTDLADAMERLTAAVTRLEHRLDGPSAPSGPDTSGPSAGPAVTPPGAT